MDFYNMLGSNFNALMFMESPAGVSNIVLTDNPPFTKEDFMGVFPNFPVGSENADEQGNYIPNEAFTLFLLMANKAIKYDRFKSQWKYMMCLYVAHMMVLYMQMIQNPNDDSMANVLRNALPTGISTSKSVDGLSISYDLMGLENDFSGYGTWKLTKYGQQLITLSRIYGKPGMWVNGI